MPSIRENIAANIETTLNSAVSGAVEFKKVVRAPISLGDLARTSFPVAVITSADEVREDITMGGADIVREGTITYWVDIYVWGDQRDQELNNLIELLEESLDTDRTRGGNSLDTEVTNIRLPNSESAKPWTSCRVFVETDYCYTRGDA